MGFKKIAVVLFNLGGPDKLEAVKPFLFNLFNDKNIITLPSFFRFFIAKLISSRREQTAKNIYAITGNKSPILQETIKQKEALKNELIKRELVKRGGGGFDTEIVKERLSTDFEVFVCMRHWHPMTDEVIEDIKKYSPQEIILLPLYPQFSTTTTASSLEEFIKKWNKVSPLNVSDSSKVKIKTICCYPSDSFFIDAHVSLIEKTIDLKNPLKNNTLQKLSIDNFKLLFSAHGLPEKIVKSGDPYQWQVEKTFLEITNKLKSKSKFKNLECLITYQSRVGPLKWLAPNTEDEIKKAAKEGKSLIIIPVAFVSEHVETLVELDVEYKKIADDYGVDYIRIPALGINDLFINGLANMVESFLQKDVGKILSSNFTRLCPDSYKKCPCQ